MTGEERKAAIVLIRGLEKDLDKAIEENKKLINFLGQMRAQWLGSWAEKECLRITGQPAGKTEVD